MGVSFFLAKLIGFYLIILFILLINRKEEMMKGMRDFVENPALLLLTGAMSLLAGLAIIIGVEWSGWLIVLNLLGLLMIARGILRLGYPALVAKWGNAFLDSEKAWNVTMIITLIIGLYLLFFGFFG